MKLQMKFKSMIEINAYLLYILNFAKKSWERFAEMPNMGIKWVKNKQFSVPLAGHKWP